MEIATKRLKLIENLHIPFWLVKDFCWAMQLKLLGIAMIFPTLSLAILICIKAHKLKVDFFSNLAILFWITANSIWMCDEFYELNIKNIAFVFFSAGIFVVLYWGIYSFMNYQKDKSSQSK